MTAIAATTETLGAVVPASPYVGLTPFTEDHAAFFFGREKERRRVARNLVASRLTLVYGGSGVGKTSLLRAGVQRDLRDEARRLVADGSVPEAIPVYVSSWRDDPVRSVLDAVGTALEALLGDRPPVLSRPDAPLADALEETLEWLDAEAERRGDPQGSELLITLDQFEEYFLYHEDDAGPGSLAVGLPDALARPHLRASFLISIREDAYTQLDLFKGRIPNLFDNYLRIDHLDRDSARRAIELPVDAFNKLVAADSPEEFAVERALVDAVLDQVRAGTVVLGQAGGGVVDAADEGIRVETPFLQLVMTRLWDEERAQGSPVLRLATLRRLGGAEEIVRSHLTTLMETLAEGERRLAAAAFHQLVTPSGSKIMHSLADLADYANVEDDELAPVLRKLQVGRLLRQVDPAPGQTSPRFEISHDVLGGAIHDWHIAYDQEDSERLRKLAEEEALRQRRRAVFSGVVALVAVVFAVLAGVAGFYAKRQSDRAQSQELATRALALLGVDPLQATTVAIDAVEKNSSATAVEALRTAVSAGRARREIATKTPVSEIAFSPGGKYLLAPSQGNLWEIRGADQREVALRVGSGRKAKPLAISADDRHALARDTGGALWLIDLEDRAPPYRLLSRSASAAFEDGGPRIAALDGLRRVRVWRFGVGRPRELRQLRRPMASSGETDTFKFQDGSVLVCCEFLDPPRTWAVESNRGLEEVSRYRARGILGIVVDFDAAFVGGRYVVSAGYLSSRVYDRRRPLAEPVRLTDTETHIVTGAPRAAVAAVADERSLVVWNARSRTPTRFRGPNGEITAAAISPDGTLAAVGAADSTAWVWDIASGAALHVLRGHADTVNSVAFSPRGNLLATASEDGTVRLWDLVTGDVTRPVRGRLFGLAMTPDASTVVVGSLKGGGDEDDTTDVVLWSRPGAESRSIALQNMPDAYYTAPTLYTVAVSANGELFAAGGRGGESEDLGVAYVWNRAAGARESRRPAFREKTDVTTSIVALAFLSDSAESAYLLSVATKRTAIRKIPSAGPSGTSAWGRGSTVVANRTAEWDAVAGGVSPNGEFVAVGGDDGRIRVYSTDDAVERARVGAVERNPPRPVPVVLGDGRDKHEGDVRAVAFSPNGRYLATAGDATVRLWDWREKRQLSVLRGHTGVAAAVAFTADGRHVVSGGSDRTTRIWDWRAGRALAVLTMHADMINNVAVAGDVIASASDDRTVRVYRCPTCGSLDSVMTLAQQRVQGVLSEEDLAATRTKTPRRKPPPSR